MSRDFVGVAEHEAGVARARRDGETAGVTAERERIKAIFALEESAGREAMARHLALNTDVTADAARALLADAPSGAHRSQAIRRRVIASLNGEGAA